MKVIEPWPESEVDLGQVRECLGLVGASLERVRYVGSEFTVPELYSSHAGFDTVLKGVELTCSSHVVAVMWMMEGVKEGLGFVLDPDRQFYEDESLRIVDVSHVRQWASLLHVPVLSCGTSWQVADDNAPRSIWSFRLSFIGGPSATIALGDLNERGILTYQPDSIAVIFDETISRSYQILASAETAWGDVTA